MATTIIIFWTLVVAVALFALMAGYYCGFHLGYKNGIATANQATIDGARIGTDEAIRRGRQEVEMYRERCKIETDNLNERTEKETEQLRKRQEDLVACQEKLRSNSAVSTVN